MNIVIINYGAGNIKSIQFAIQRLGYEAILSHNIKEIQGADKVIFPGVGEAGSAMKKLIESGLDTIIPTLSQPVLGICLGMQLMCNYSDEGNTKGLGIFNVGVTKFNNDSKVPQIGWNKVSKLKTELFSDIDDEEYMYAVHSYYAPLCEETIGVSDYGLVYSSALQKDNFYGVNFIRKKVARQEKKFLKTF